ncbi:hypothetical protein FNH22_21835 [Fulvivirga sp. M361]|uniref:hypothetical protein n=1 Tax=Fulvivirga sp. M361 TaxID=2594266 RepID=UPI001179DC7D|nr:hypothetical protein [Fulvivirga sp. M361]TRX52357.1 hypothetical protein FNH22_21835 [Fulvivirga sp. M361]
MKTNRLFYLKYFVGLLFMISVQAVSAQNICIDTLMYPEAKATSFSEVIFNVPSEFAGYSQYYDAPQDIIVKGFKVYMGVNSANSLDTAIVTGYLMDANPDSSVSTILRQKDFTVYNIYNLSNISSMEYHVIFDIPDTVIW